MVASIFKAGSEDTLSVFCGVLKGSGLWEHAEGSGLSARAAALRFRLTQRIGLTAMEAVELAFSSSTPRSKFMPQRPAGQRLDPGRDSAAIHRDADLLDALIAKPGRLSSTMTAQKPPQLPGDQGQTQRHHQQVEAEGLGNGAAARRCSPPTPS